MQPPADGGEDLLGKDIIQDDFGNNDDGNVHKIIANEDGSQEFFGVASEVYNTLTYGPFLFFDGSETGWRKRKKRHLTGRDQTGTTNEQDEQQEIGYKDPVDLHKTYNKP